MPIKPLFYAVFTTALTACQQADTHEKTNDGLHQTLIERLQQSDSAIAPILNIHPVTATYNREAIIPPMCYTRKDGRHNPCYVCHQDSIPTRENTMNDGELQRAYSFSDLGMNNRWHNLFKQRRHDISTISDRAIIAWVNQDNYSELTPRLHAEAFQGWIPDLQNLHLGAQAFEASGFAKDGSHWVAFNYKPFPSTFWPTNGATDDVMIRLPAKYRNDNDGHYSQDIYRANLAILEANIKGIDRIGSLPIDERRVGADLNGDDRLSRIEAITRTDRYVGAAEAHFINTFLYPKGTEFMHSVRYLSLDDEGLVVPSTRMKEVRYLKKWKSYPKATIARIYQEEAFDKDAGNLPGYTRLGDYGLDNDAGWSVQSFIENSHGRLRTATYEENLFCMGCHGSIGSTIDKTFSFARKMDGTAGWGYINLKGMPDVPTQGEQQGEFLTYFQRAGGGDEFRSNPEMLARWFHKDGTVNKDAVIGKDVYQLITPSAERALQLNKAYRQIVKEQSYIYGRDARWHPPSNVHQFVNNEQAATLEDAFIYTWDIRLDWRQKVAQ